jgi:hypothetical protein
MNKMDSDRTATVEPMEPNFSKRKSEGKTVVHPPEHLKGPAATEDHREAQSNLSNVATLSSLQV